MLLNLSMFDVLFQYLIGLDIMIIDTILIKGKELFDQNNSICCTLWGELNRLCESVIYYIEKIFGFDPGGRGRVTGVQPLELQQPSEINFEEVQDLADIEAMEPGVMEELSSDEVKKKDDTGPNKNFYIVLIGASLLMAVVVFGVTGAPVFLPA